MAIFDELAANLKQMEADCRFDLAKIDADVMTFLSGLGQHAIENPEPVFAILRRFRPVLLVRNYALITLYADV